jgi:hypothetical protein
MSETLVRAARPHEPKSCPKWNDDTATLHFLASIRPPRHHADPLFPIIGTGIACRADSSHLAALVSYFSTLV